MIDVEQGHRQDPQRDDPQALAGYKAQTGFFIFECRSLLAPCASLLLVVTTPQRCFLFLFL